MDVESVSEKLEEDEEDDLLLNNNYYRKNKFGSRRDRRSSGGSGRGGEDEKSCDSKNESRENNGSKSSNKSGEDDLKNSTSTASEGDDSVVSAPGDDADPKCDMNVKSRKAAAAAAARVNNENEALVENLSDGCGRNLFNLDFLVGRPGCREPFLVLDSLAAQDILRNPVKAVRRKERALAKTSNNSNKGRLLKNGVMLSGAKDDGGGKVFLKLRSAKMRGLKDLLCAEKLNTSAIQLQLTAQSQTDVSKDQASTSAAGGTRPKRARRE